MLMVGLGFLAGTPAFSQAAPDKPKVEKKKKAPKTKKPPKEKKKKASA